MRVAVSQAPIVMSRANPERAGSCTTVFDRGEGQIVRGASVTRAKATTKPQSAIRPTTKCQARIGNNRAAMAGTVALPRSPEKL